MGDRTKIILALILLLGGVIFLGYTSNNEAAPEPVETKPEPEPEHVESKITDDMVLIELEKPKDFYIVPWDAPLYRAGYPLRIYIEGGNKTFFVAAEVYHSLVGYLYSHGVNQPFYIKTEQRHVLLNPYADVITHVFDSDGNPMPELEPEGLDMPAKVKAMLIAFDANGDRKIEFADGKNNKADGIEEFQLWIDYADATICPLEPTATLFKEYDVNGNEHLDKTELDKLLSDSFFK